MKTYWSIPGPSKAPIGEPCIAFYKHDGSNIRIEWSEKQGWYKFGTRRIMIDKQDPYFGSVPELFLRTQAEGIEKVLRDKYPHDKAAVVFLEWFGPSSFGNYHNYGNEEFRLVLIEVNIHKRGFVLPRQFVKNFGHLDAAHVVYQGTFDQQLIQDVKDNKFGLKEGIVAKGVTGNSVHDLWMTKVKTNWWMDELRRRSLESIEFKKLLEENEREQNAK
jgi:hypothetical protein